MLAKVLADKKKVLVIALSGAVVLGVGAFMFSRPQDTPPAHPKPAKHLQGAKPEQLTSSPTADGKTPAGQAGGPGSVVADASPQAAGRDPFDGSRYEPLPKNNQPPTQPAKSNAGISTLPSGQQKAIKPFMPGGIAISPDGSIPNPDQLSKLLGTKGSEFKYTLIGVITGIHPAVVFATPDGKHQQLIQLGNSLAPGTRVTAVSRAKATVYNNGQELRMTVGADNPTEKRSDEK